MQEKRNEELSTKKDGLMEGGDFSNFNSNSWNFVHVTHTKPTVNSRHFM